MDLAPFYVVLYHCRWALHHYTRTLAGMDIGVDIPEPQKIKVQINTAIKSSMQRNMRNKLGEEHFILPMAGGVVWTMGRGIKFIHKAK